MAVPFFFWPPVDTIALASFPLHAAKHSVANWGKRSRRLRKRCAHGHLRVLVQAWNAHGGTLRAAAPVAAGHGHAYGGFVPLTRTVMTSPSQRYRITVTPIEKDGLQCSGRCTIELEHRAQQDWMRLLEIARRQTGLSGDERAAAIVATQLLHDLARRHAQDPTHPLTGLQPQLGEVLQALEAIQQAP